jgi:hypothetical protein
MQRVLERLPPGCVAGGSPFVDHLYSLKVGGRGDAPPGGRVVRQFHLLYDGLTRLVRTLDLDEALDDLEWRLQCLVIQAAPDLVAVHAGVVGWRDRAILLPGYSFSGKSTLVVELLKLGAVYYSDDLALLDGRGWVHPYARRVSLRPPGENASRLRVGAEELGSRTGREPLPVGLVAFARYKVQSAWRPRPLSPGQAALELLNCTLSARQRPEASLAALEGVVSGAVCCKGPRGDAAQAAPALLCQADEGGVPPAAVGPRC